MGRFNPFIWIRGGLTSDEPPPQVTRFGGIANERPELTIFPQEAPDPVRQGAVPSRPARMPVAILTGIEPDAVAEGRFVVDIIHPQPHATFPRDRMTPQSPRSNVRVPPHIAYGSLFIAGPSQGFH